MLKTQSLQRQFRSWTILLVVVPSLLIMTIYTVVQIKIAREKNMELIDQRVSSQRRLIESWMAERADVVREISKTEAFQTLDEQHMKRTLDFKQEMDTNFDSISYVDRDGFFRMSTLRSGIRYQSANSQPYYQAALAGKEYVSGVVIGRNSGLPIINFSAPVYDRAGQFQGLILGSIRTTRLEELLREGRMGQTGGIQLVNSDGLLLTRPRFIDTLIAEGTLEGFAVMQVKISEDALRNIRLGEAGTATWTSLLGKKVLGSYRSMPEQGWTLIGKIDEEEVLAPIYDQLRMMAVGTIMLLLVILPLAALLTNRIRRPIEWLITQSDMVAAGNYHMVGRDKVAEKVPYELDALCETFVKMSRSIENNISLLRMNEVSLQSKINEIQDMNAELQAEIRERQEIEEALQRANHALALRDKENRALLNAVPDFIFEIDNAGVIRSARGTRIKYDKPPAEQVGKSIFELHPAEIAQTLMENIWIVLATHATRACQWSLIIDGETHIREARISSYKEAVALVLVRDITAEKRAEQKNIEANRLVEQGQRLAALGIMATSIAHEINQPLNSIKISSSGAAFTLRNKIPRTEADLLKEFERIAKEVDRVNKIISNIRMFVKEDYSNRRSVNLKNVIEQAITTIASQPLFQDITIKLQVQDDLTAVLANELHLQQVVINLLMNAAQAMAASAQSSKMIGITTWVDNHVIVEVWDNGPGISDDMKARIFEPFFSAKASTQSMGLGLAIAQTIVSAYGGRIGVYDNDGGGATFRIEFHQNK